MGLWVAGFLISPDRVALVRKNRPAWQAGKLNAIGGKIEANETPFEAMRREFKEETGHLRDDWNPFVELTGQWGSVFFFRAFTEHFAGVRTMEDEEIEIHPIDDVPYDECVPNVSWLLPLARYVHDDYNVIFAQEKEY